MPDRIKELESFKDFKQNLKSFLLDHPFYSLNEFFLNLIKVMELIKQIKQSKIGCILFCNYCT
jgi:hypothetical protein